MYYSEVYDLFEQWQESKPKQLINFIVEYLDEDKYWLASNIGKVDKETLIKIGKYLENANATN